MISNFPARLDGLYGRLYQPMLMIFSLILAMICAAAVMWDPQLFANKIGGFTALNAPALIWATCTGLIHGVGFKPHFWLWKILFFPPLAWLVMVPILAYALV